MQSEKGVAVHVVKVHARSLTQIAVSVRFVAHVARNNGVYARRKRTVVNCFRLVVFENLFALLFCEVVAANKRQKHYVGLFANLIAPQVQRVQMSE